MNLKWGPKVLNMAREMGKVIRGETATEMRAIEVRIDDGDCIASEAKYHAQCYLGFTNKYRGMKK